METIIINTSEHFKTEQIIAFLKDIQVSFKVKKKEEKPYDPAFVAMVLEASKGRRKRINPENVWESIL